LIEGAQTMIGYIPGTS